MSLRLFFSFFLRWKKKKSPKLLAVVYSVYVSHPPSQLGRCVVFEKRRPLQSHDDVVNIYTNTHTHIYIVKQRNSIEVREQAGLPRKEITLVLCIYCIQKHKDLGTPPGKERKNHT